MLQFVSPLMVLLSLVGGNTAQQFGNCDYTQILEPGQKYYVYNAEYSQPYRPGTVCRWVARSDRPIDLTCDPVMLPASANCSQDALIVQDGSMDAHRYCGKGTFSLVSKTNQLTIILTSPTTSPGGTFLCTLSSHDETSCRCGWKNPTRIVGGVETGVNEYPMMAGLVDLKHRIIFCGATIINERQVLTAAHCVNSRQISKVGVVIGEHDVTKGSETNATKLYRVESIRVHENYTPGSLDYDIALVTIKGTIAYNSQVGPACLPFQHSPDTFAGNYVDVLGWGTTEFAGAPSNTLQKAKLSVITNFECKRTYRDLSTRQLCTDGQGKDSCQMDSGGPVLWQNPTTRRVVEIGLISLGSACANGAPATNSRIGAFIDWIVRYTPRGTTYCRLE